MKSKPSDTADATRKNYASLDDQVLVQLALQRDPDATDALVRRYTPLLLGFLRGRIPRAYEDVYQDAFSLALARLDSLRQHDRFGPWLLKIAHHALVDWTRADSRHAATRNREQIAGAIHGWSDAPNPGHTVSEEAQGIVDSIFEQPEPYRLVLYLSLIHEQEPQTIALELGLRPGTVRMRLKRGLSKLRNTLKRKGLT